MTKLVDPQAVRQAIEKLPLFSSSALQLLQVVADPDHELEDVVKIVKFDSALTMRVLKAVNSPVYGLINEVTSIDRALSYIGERTVISIAIQENTGQLFSKPLDGYLGGQGALWRHDLFSAIASREVARHAKGDFDLDLAFTGGLLHDIGKSVFATFWKQAAKEALGQIDQGVVNDYLMAEHDLAGLAHTEVGYEMARHWQLPESLQAVILHHHHPAEAIECVQPLVYAVHVGDIVSMMAGCDTGSDGLQYQLDSGYKEFFNLSPAILAEIVLNAEEEFSKAEASLVS